ncbi:hypothetical protein [Zobellia roscoffensis]|uniref:hypothetical protein n=1 Tax=Zobellia roscoffensis TaxID=2779508 RepID=UPI00188CD30F|nr:hypothetical protein [Zobellia roscoffensis]
MQKLKDKGGLIIFILICSAVLIGSYNKCQNNISLKANKEMTIGRVTGFKHGSRNERIQYQFYVNSKLYRTSDLYRPRLQHKRNTKPRKKQFYYVEYDATDPSNSKILIQQQKSIGPNALFQDGIDIKANVDKISAISDSYVDLYISYAYLKNKYKFRTRIHKDSLPCGTIDNCEQGEVDLTISKYFPDANNLYFKSYDRMAMKKAKEERR